MRTWNKRAVQGTLIRLDQSGMIKRFRVRRKKSEDSWVICFQVLREPRSEDYENLGFRRQAAITDTTDELLQDDGGGDTLMRDLEIDMLDDGEDDEQSHSLDEDIRIPPQWTPERLLSNTIFEFTALGEVAGWDAVVVRNRIVGPFWRRPTESYLTRLTDDWKRTQPPYLRHLAIIRDTRNTEEKKFIHYVYRTYSHFEEAVKAGEAIWAGAARPTLKQTKTLAEEEPKVNIWGFHDLDQQDFVRFNGTATLSDVRSAIFSRRYGPRWDNALAQELGYQKKTPVPAKFKKEKTPKKAPGLKKRKGIVEREGAEQTVDVQNTGSAQENGRAQQDATSRPEDAEERTTPAVQDEDTSDEDDSTLPSTPVPSKLKGSKAKKKGSGVTLELEERIKLGLKPTGRLTKSAAQQILAHRAMTGDPNSLPDKLDVKPVGRNGHVPLMTKEERLAAGLSVKGRLGIRKENEIREQRGMPKLVEKGKKKKVIKNDTPVLTKQQRIALGFIGHGRLHQHFIDALRKEQKNDVPLEESPAVEAYREFLKAEAEKEVKRQERRVHFGRQTPATEAASPQSLPTEVASETSVSGTREEVAASSVGAEPLPSITPSSPKKRKAEGADVSLSVSKRQRTSSESASVRSPTVPDSVEYPSEVVSSVESANGAVTRDKTATPTTPRHTPQAVRERTSQTDGDTTEQPVRSSHSVEPVATSEDKARRLLPGVHIYPDVKRKLGRGRPRKAYIVAFRLARLSELAKFSRGEDSGYETDKIVSWGSRKGTPNVTSEPVIDEAATPTEDQPTPSHMPTANADEEATPDDLNEPMDVVEEVETRVETPPAQDGIVGAATATREEITASASPTCKQPMYRPIAPSTLLNTSAQVTKPSYQSPYAPQIQPKVLVPRPRLDDIDVRKSATPLANVSTGSNEVESTSLPRGVTGPIAELPNVVSPKKTKRRGPQGQITGTQRLLRREIIMEIIDRCGGAYPLHGEIWRPFQALWDQRHGHAMKLPDSSVVHDTLKQMIPLPAYGLKRMTFRVKNRNSTGSYERSIVTKIDMTPNHPTVQSLASSMANDSHEKSQQFFPEEIRNLFDYKTSYVPPTDAPKVEGITMEDVCPDMWKIKENKTKERLARKKEEKRLAREAARKLTDEQVTRVMPKRTRRKQAEKTAARGEVTAPREKRARLASLNDKAKQYLRAPVQAPAADLMEVSEEDETRRREPSPARSDSSEDAPLMSLRPLARETIEVNEDDEDEVLSSETDEEGDAGEEMEVEEAQALPSPSAPIPSVPTKDPFRFFKSLSFTHPVVTFHVSSGTFSTSFKADTKSRRVRFEAPGKTVRKSKKRARVDSTTIDRPAKKARRTKRTEDVLDDEFVYSSVEDTDGTSSEDEEDEDEEEEKERPKKKSRKRRAFKGRQLGKKQPMPTLLERLTGLTGDPNDPIYQDPKQRDRPGKPRPWAERKRKQLNKLRKEREYVETMDHTDEFKRLCFTLVIASSMSGVEGVVDWSIVAKVYTRDKFFDMLKVKNLWAWMKEHMATELAELTETLQASVLAAYEAGKLPDIDDLESYDWAGLLRWTMRSCAWSALPLPLYHEALAQFDVDESSYATLNRVSWHSKKIADATRTHLALQLAFVAPLHRKNEKKLRVDDKVLKARSWTRANIATPQSIYDANQAHDKLKPLGEDVLTKVVTQFVQDEHLRLRKLKRQLPGRNYTFTKKFAKTYKRPFELEDFMVATTVKKALDMAFTDENSDKRFYSISRCEEDGSVMAIMSMAAAGQVKLMPQLPPVNDSFGAPLPRLSKWGFCEGDYIHRAIDRNRLFWDIHIVPTEDYKFGSPLHSLTDPAADWPALTEPPLPGKHDPDALLPIWSSIDSQTVTWPWWYRILNLVLQPLYLQPGATAPDVFAHCPENTTELFEVQLVLDWLASVGGITKIVGGGYQVTHGFWAAFGDRLHDVAGDWFGAHVKRKNKLTTKMQWRDKYNEQYAAMQTRKQANEQSGNGKVMRKKSARVGAKISGRPVAQYGILLEEEEGIEPVVEVEEVVEEVQADEQMGMNVRPTPDVQEDAMDVEGTPQTSHTPIQIQDVDTEMMDADIDAEGEDEDAEGEWDDEMY